MADFSILFDEEELHPDCTVQIWRNSVTGEESVGWWENEGARMEDKLMDGIRAVITGRELEDAVLSWLFEDPDEFGFLSPPEGYGFRYLPGGAGKEEKAQLEAIWTIAAACFGDPATGTIYDVAAFRGWLIDTVPETEEDDQ